MNHHAFAAHILEIATELARDRVISRGDAIGAAGAKAADLAIHRDPRRVVIGRITPDEPYGRARFD